MRHVACILALLAVSALARRPRFNSASGTASRPQKDWTSPWETASLHLRAASGPAGSQSRFPEGASGTVPNFGQFYSVLDFGAVPDGVTDNTAAFSAALNATAAAGGVVWVPTGRYLFAGSIVVPPSTVMQGVYRAPPAHNAGQGAGGVQPVTGTVLMPTAGRGNESATPFLTLSDNSAVTGVVFFYPEQVQDAAPQPYPWTVALAGENCAVMDSELLNSYNGIQAHTAPRHYIARVQGQPTNIGVSVDSTYDIGRIENVHFNPWYSSQPVYLEHQLTYGVAFTIARSDWEYVFNTFVFGMAVGYRFTESAEGSCNGNFVVSHSHIHASRCGEDAATIMKGLLNAVDLGGRCCSFVTL